MGISLLVNTGSASKKYALYRDGGILLAAHFEYGKNGPVVTIASQESPPETGTVTPEIYDGAIAKLLDVALDSGILSGPADIMAVGIRIVAPGTFFTEHRVIDDDYLAKLQAVEPYAPRHISHTVSEIQKIRLILRDTLLVGVSDSAFHNTMPESARKYGINAADTKEFDIYRFGFHGLSVGSVLSRLPGISGNWMPEKMIVCHLGATSSVTALDHGSVIDTTMGFSPISGLVMGTRSGDIDAGAALYLAQQKGMDFAGLREYLACDCGLQGLTGECDMRELLDRRFEGDQVAVEAIDLYLYRIRKYIGAYHAVLGRLDALVLTGAMVEKNQHLRRQLCEGLEHVGVVIDYEKNKALDNALGDEEGYINQEGEMGIAVVKSDEMGEMADIVQAFPRTYIEPALKEVTIPPAEHVESFIETRLREVEQERQQAAEVPARIQKPEKQAIQPQNEPVVLHEHHRTQPSAPKQEKQEAPKTEVNPVKDVPIHDHTHTQEQTKPAVSAVQPAPVQELKQSMPPQRKEPFVDSARDLLTVVEADGGVESVPIRDNQKEGVRKRVHPETPVSQAPMSKKTFDEEIAGLMAKKETQPGTQSVSLKKQVTHQGAPQRVAAKPMPAGDDSSTRVNITINKPTNVNVTGVQQGARSLGVNAPKRVSIQVESDSS